MAGFPFSMFRAQQPQQQGQDPNQQTQGQQPIPKGQAQGSSPMLENMKGQDPNSQKSGEDQNTPANELDPFKELWNNGAKDDKGGKPQPFLPYDKAKLKESAKTLNFAKDIPQELLGKALAGDQQAFLSILNQVSQASFASALDASLTMAERGFSSAESRFMERVPSEIKRHSVSDATFSENPRLNHPAVKPVFEGLMAQFQGKYPDASSSEIRKMATDYMKAMNKALSDPENADDPTKKPGASGALQKSEDQDWDKFIGVS